MCSYKSEIEKWASRFFFKRYESRLQFLMRTQSTASTAHFVIGDAYNSCAGNFALTRSLQVARGTSRGELPSMHGTDAVSRLCKNGRVFLRSKNMVVSGSRMYRERALLGIALLSRESKNADAFFSHRRRMRIPPHCSESSCSCRVCGEALYSLVQMLRL